MSHSRPTSLAIVGFGKIAQDQHVPAVFSSSRFSLAAVASPGPIEASVPTFETLATLLSEMPDVEAIAVCTPPHVRREVAEMAIRAGKHVLLEKPPATTLSEAMSMEELARSTGVTLFTAWHSRYAPGVEAARDYLKTRKIISAEIIWREDVRVWHPGQRWIWEAGGFGVFDPGINALSILTHVCPGPMFVDRAHLQVPANCSTPLRADFTMVYGAGAPIGVHLDFMFEGPPDWRIDFQTSDGVLSLDRGGAALSINGVAQATPAVPEYDGVYDHFARLIASGRSDTDLTPLILTSDALALAERSVLPPFEDA